MHSDYKGVSKDDAGKIQESVSDKTELDYEWIGWIPSNTTKRIHCE